MLRNDRIAAAHIASAKRLLAAAAQIAALPLALRLAVAIFAWAALYPTHAEDGFGIEDDTLRPVSPAALSALRA
ncbi:MAG TPA: hypothetical protein VGF27_22570, partial [Pseudoduganella sp.]